MNNRFEKGSGCFECENCQNLTRKTDNNTNLCKKCYDKLEEENSEE